MVTRFPGAEEERRIRPRARSNGHERPERSRWVLPLDASGRYSAVSLRPGTYRLELMKAGGEATFSLKMALAGQEPLEPGRLLGETEVRAGETARLDAAVR